MAPTTPTESVLADPLSETARKERRVLLGLSVVAILIAKTGSMPTEITNLGIKFSPNDRSTLLKGLAVVVLYFLWAFVLYASTDFLRWRLTFFRSWQETEEALEKARLLADARASGGSVRLEGEIDEGELNSMREFFARKTNRLRAASIPTVWLRAAFEFGLPVIVGAYAVAILVRSW